MSPSACTTPGCAPSKTASTPTTSSTKACSKQKVGTKEFAQAVVARLGQKPEKLKAVSYSGATSKNATAHADQASGGSRSESWSAWTCTSTGRIGSPEQLASARKVRQRRRLKLTMIDNRGVKVWPGRLGRDVLHGQLPLPLHRRDGDAVTQAQMLGLLRAARGRGPRDRARPSACATSTASPDSRWRKASSSARSHGCQTAGRRDHGQQVRLGDDAARRRDSHRFGVPHECRDRLGASHAASDGRVCGRGGGPRHRSHHRRARAARRICRAWSRRTRCCRCSACRWNRMR